LDFNLKLSGMKLIIDYYEKTLSVENFESNLEELVKVLNELNLQKYKLKFPQKTTFFRDLSNPYYKGNSTFDVPKEDPNKYTVTSVKE